MYPTGRAGVGQHGCPHLTALQLHGRSYVMCQYACVLALIDEPIVVAQCHAVVKGEKEWLGQTFNIYISDLWT